MKRLFKKIAKPFLVTMSTVLLLSSPLSVFAEKDVKSKKVKKEEMPQLDITAEAAFLYDLNLNKVIYKKNEKKEIPTASLTQLMTLLIASDQLTSGKVKRTDSVLISEKAWKTGGNRMFLEVGKTVSFNELFKGLAVVNGNDAAVSVAEHIDGTTEKFVDRMNKKAQSLGMKNTEFHSVTGMLDGEVADTSTAEDLSLLGKNYLTEYPGNLPIHNLPSFAYDTGRGVIEQTNRNSFLRYYNGTDGLKSGYIGESYNLITTAQKDNVRLLVVTLNSPSEIDRAKDTRKILDYGFNQYGKYVLAEKGQKITTLPVYKAKDETKVEIIAKDEAKVVMHSSLLKKGEIQKKTSLPHYINASKGIKAGEKVGTISYMIGKKKIEEVDLVVKESLEPAAWWGKLLDSIILSGKWVINLFK